jgi:hypothetical protein
MTAVIFPEDGPKVLDTLYTVAGHCVAQDRPPAALLKSRRT